MWYLLVPLIILVGVGTKYALVAPLREFLAQPVLAESPVAPSPHATPSPPGEDERLTKAMTDVWIRECRSDAV